MTNKELDKKRHISDQVYKGQAIYTKRILSIYDLYVIWFSCSFLWKCPRHFILDFFNQNVTSRHLDIGVGTGYYLDYCVFPSSQPLLVLLDLNMNSLETAKRRLKRYQPQCYQQNVLEKIKMSGHVFQSISMNFLLHCLPGSFPEKLISLKNVDHLLEKGGCIFGTTILPYSQESKIGFFAKKIMKIYNKKGIFNNQDDRLEDLQDFLAKNYSNYTLDVRGCVAFFKAIK